VLEVYVMRRILTLTVAAMVFVLVPLPRVAAQTGQTPNTLAVSGPPPKATLEDVRWLVGRWTGTGLGGVSEEIWAEAAGGAMMGMYRLVVDGKVSFYELMNLVEVNGSLVLKLKHFNADLTAWEEKDRFVSFSLVKLTATEVWFSGLTFRRVGDDGLRIFLALRSADGTIREEEFKMQRSVLK
jgi:hypothetical protein